MLHKFLTPWTKETKLRYTKGWFLGCSTLTVFTSMQLSFSCFRVITYFPALWAAHLWYRSFLSSMLPFINNSSRLCASTLSQKSDLSRNSFVFEHVHAWFCLPFKSPKNRCQIKIQISGLRTNWSNWIARQQPLPFCSSYKDMHEMRSPRQNCGFERAQKGIPFCKLYLPTFC